MRKLLLIILCANFFACHRKTAREADPMPEETREIFTEGAIAFDSTRLERYHHSSLSRIYRLYEFKTIWQDSVRRRSALQVLLHADRLGFDPELYRISTLYQFENLYAQLNDRQRTHYDILLTHCLRRCLSHVTYGQAGRDKMPGNWAIYQAELPITRMMFEAIEADSLSGLVQALEPKSKIYRGLKRALARLDALPAYPFRKIPFSGNLKRGKEGSMVAQIKDRLHFWGDMTKVTAGNVLDKATSRALMRFQSRHGLPVTGTVNEPTVRELNVTPAERRRQIVLNLERWRWFPSLRGERYIVVNIPAYELFLIEEQDTADYRKVVVGKADRRTPVLSSAMNEVILNPTWTVPPTIIKEDLGPDAAKDTNYFRNRRLTIYDWRGNRVPASKWDATKPENYKYVQDPGSDNSLGHVKFNFPNHFMVYLHDTNHRDYFSRHRRSLSSGCVRVDDPLPFAETIIRDSVRWNLDKIKEVVTTGETTSIWLRKKIPIYQLYWTAWMDDQGRIQFREDIYSLDRPLYNALRN